ncbi:hypothetical protein F442_14880 [Phytophthora nicotianae P10297]|uniref:RxLR effector protein n=1 Tax=Phytophthora nicotianae P10297 TaxID=1317064 RepID=W2YQL2_PHYNI|nr:hypothetical protein F442_14880 [Phytophthora nicotianae P10297]
MRQAIIVFVAAATLIVSCDAAMLGSPDSKQSIDAASAKTTRFLRGVDTEDDSDGLGFIKEERAGTQLQFVDDLLAKLAINEAVALKNLNRFDDDLMEKLRKNPS